MGQNRSEIVNRLYQAVQTVEPERRSIFLKQACQGDDSLQQEVESLLALHDDDPRKEKETEFLALDRNNASLMTTFMMRRFAASELVGSRFEIVRFISHGGMGDVYEAKDLHLGGRVALKTIRPDIGSDERMIARFKQEILLAKKVTHPNVCRIYDVGFHSDPRNQPERSGYQSPGVGMMFLSMELLEGETLSARVNRGHLKPTEALPIVEQMVAGLTAAHDAGIVHRDFKSVNVMLVPSEEGKTRVVITDFGLARNVHSSRNQATSVSLTQEGEIAGTPDYMAPEQVLGGEITPAVDIYALGVVMYEMLTGKRPFDGDTPLAIATKRLNECPPSPRKYIPNLDRKWETVILRCLERQPSHRFSSANEVVRALTGPERLHIPIRTALTRRVLLYGALASGGSWALWRVFFTKNEHSIAILPFINTDPTLDYVSDGITEDLIQVLGQIPTLRVMSRAAVYGYIGKDFSPQQVGRALNVGYILSGKVVQRGDSISIAVELTEADTGVHLWGQRYDVTMSEISVVEEDISRGVINEFQLQLGPDEQKRFASRREVSPEVKEFYWKARYFWNKRTQEGFRRAIEYFNSAIERDPRFALAYTGLADCYAMQSGAVPPTEVFPKAKAAALKALQLDDTLAEAHTSLAFTNLFFDWDWHQAEKEFKRAIQLNPNYPSAHSWYAMYLIAMKRFDQALVEMRRALELDPASLPINTGVGRVLFYARRYPQAAAQYRRTLEMNPDFSEALFDLGMTFAAQGKYDESIRQLERGIKASGENAGAIAEIAYVNRRSGRKLEAELAVQTLQALSKKRYVSPYFFAVAQLGANQDAALDFLEQAYRDRSFSMIYLNVDYRFDELRSDSRYTGLLRRLRFIS